ncbi:bifunctional 3'-5' exonuclease/DNA polymerase [uncultured Caudovirales phage]|uniref:Bifunctional 3'-5' exonuclease/DNA polymerase n=1 Tax=uncultured Caudovirales phage TaxID=2100421 RepID=A0A6J5MKV4_9CAUD|nr:bifunctional 3'-5' exonuclease/DNA polymerase [uncultured Caudovirales phage]
MVVSIDFETRSAVDLRKTGVYKYAADPSTDIWCMAYKAPWSDDVQVWLPSDELDTRLAGWIIGGGLLSAWNANFERTIWNEIMTERYEWPPTKIKQWRCTMAQASAMGLPRALGQAASVLGVEEQKDKAGAALMLRMARPRKVNADGSYTWWNTKDKIDTLVAYCIQDVKTELSVAATLNDMPDSERRLYQLDQRINDRGVKVDLDLIERVSKLANSASENIDAEIKRLTNGQVKAATNAMDLTAWLRSYGLQVKSVDKQTVTRMLGMEKLHPIIKQVLRLRQDGAKSSTAKYEAMVNAANADNRMRGLLMYHGAATGRWSGRLVQPQNFPRPQKKNDELETIIAKLKADEDVSEYGAGTVLASDLLRSMLIADDGHRLMFADYSAIEARVLAWIAGQTDLVETFRKGGDVYKEMASAIYNVNVENVTDGQRQVGKMAILGCGYGMGGKRFAEQCATMGINVDEDEAKRIVSVYREKNDRIAQYWRNSENEFVEMVKGAGRVGSVGLPLPSGRSLTYHNPRIIQRETPWGAMRDTAQVDTLNSVTRQWVSQIIWGGLLTENVVQATARDLMATAMMALELKGYNVILSVHDEIISEVPDGFGSLEEMIDIMTRCPSWADGCPINAEGKEGKRYRK